MKSICLLFAAFLIVDAVSLKFKAYFKPKFGIGEPPMTNDSRCYVQRSLTFFTLTLDHDLVFLSSRIKRFEEPQIPSVYSADVGNRTQLVRKVSKLA